MSCCANIGRITANWWDYTTHPDSDPTVLKIRSLEREFHTTPGEKEKSTLQAQVIKLAFDHKRIHPEYEMAKLAKKTFETAHRITNAPNDDYILNHPKEYAFLTDKFHYFDKHIITLVDHWDVDARVRVVEGNLCFKIGNNFHSVSDALKEAEAHPNQVFDLDQFALGKRDYKLSCRELRKNFQYKEWDKGYALQIVINNPVDIPSPSRHHAWIRLVDQEGKVISVGKYPEKMIVSHPYGTQPASWRNADEYEYLAMGREKTYTIPLLGKEYDRLKRKIEMTMKMQSDTTAPKEDFNIFNGINCTDWVIDIASKYIEIDREECRIDQLATLIPGPFRFFEKIIPQWIKCIFRPIGRIFSIVFHAFSWILYLLMGGFSRNPKNPDSKPLISSWRDLFDDRKTMTTHPLYLRQWLDNHFDEAIQKRSSQ